MSQLKRLMPGRSVQQYKRKNLRALVGHFFQKRGNKDCGCVLTANFIRKSDARHSHYSLSILTHIILERATAYCGSRDYVDGVMNGFDGREMANQAYYTSKKGWDSYSQGYADGRKTIELLRKHGLTYSG